MADLTPAAQAIWEKFNEDEPGVFVGYNDNLAAALEELADQVVPPPEGDGLHDCCIDTYEGIRAEILAIAKEMRS